MTASPDTGEVALAPAGERSPAGAAGEKRQTLYLRLPSMDSHEMTQFRRIAYLFEGKEPVRIRLIDSGKLIGTTAALHPAFVRAMRELLGDENVVLK